MLVRSLLLLSLAAGGAFTDSSLALAHSPYFTQIEKIALPGGEMGEIRLLHGDGVFFADPVRAIIVNAEGRAVARTHQAGAMVILCAPGHQCRAFDLARLRAFEPEPATFRPGMLLSQDAGIWEVESGAENWGFRMRWATASEIVESNVAYALRYKLFLFVPFVLAGLAGLAFFNWSLRPTPPRRLTRLVWILTSLFRLVVAAFLGIITIYWIAFTGISLLQWFAVSAAGCGFMLALRGLLRRLFARPAAA